MMEKEIEFITTTEACELLNVSKTVIKRMADDGSLESWKTPGGHRRLKRSAVLKIMAQQNGVYKKDQDVVAIKALVIDDDLVVGEIFSQLTKNLDMNIDLVYKSDGYSGLLSAGQNKYDVIFVDLDMPKLDGYEVINTLTQQPDEDVNIMVITANSKNDVDMQRLPKGITVLTKPLDLQVLVQFLRYEYKLKNALK